MLILASNSAQAQANIKPQPWPITPTEVAAKCDKLGLRPAWFFPLWQGRGLYTELFTGWQPNLNTTAGSWSSTHSWDMEADAATPHYNGAQYSNYFALPGGGPFMVFVRIEEVIANAWGTDRVIRNSYGTAGNHTEWETYVYSTVDYRFYLVYVTEALSVVTVYWTQCQELKAGEKNISLVFGWDGSSLRLFINGVDKGSPASTVGTPGDTVEDPSYDFSRFGISGTDSAGGIQARYGLVGGFSGWSDKAAVAFYEQPYELLQPYDPTLWFPLGTAPSTSNIPAFMRYYRNRRAA